MKSKVIYNLFSTINQPPDDQGIDEDAVFQAEKYLSYTQRGGDGAFWWQSKYFTPRQKRAIRTAIFAIRRHENRHD